MAPWPSRGAINNVRFGSLADIAACPRYVRFTPESGHSRFVGLSGKGHKGTFQETVLYNPSTMNARDFVALIRMAVISFVF